MRRILSVWMLAVKPLLWKVLLLLIAMAAAELALFSVTLERHAEAAFGMILQASHGAPVFIGAVVLLTVLLCLQGCQFSGGKLRYTLQRLPMGETKATVLWIFVHGSCYVLLWAAQLAVVLVQWRMYAEAFAVQAPALQLFVESYLDGFLHSLIPLQDGTRWMRNLTFYGSLSVMTAFFGYFQRRGRFRAEPAIALATGLFVLRTDFQNREADITITVILLAVLAILLYAVWGELHETD